MSIEFTNKWILLIINLYKRLASRQLKPADALMICITVLSLTVIHWTSQETIYFLLFRWALMLPLLFILALISDNYDNINEKVTYAYLIITSDLTLDEKKHALKNHFRLLTDKWSSYYEEFQTIINDKKAPFKKRWMKLYDLTCKIIYGHISLPKIIYIIGYSFYALFISENMFHISPPADIIINLVFLVFLRYAGAELKGWGELLNDFIDALKPGKTDNEYNLQLNEIADKIKDGCYASFILTQGETEKKIVEVKQGVKCYPNGTLMTKEQIELEDAKEQSIALGEISTKALQEKAIINGQIIQTETIKK